MRTNVDCSKLREKSTHMVKFREISMLHQLFGEKHGAQAQKRKSHGMWIFLANGRFITILSKI